MTDEFDATALAELVTAALQQAQAVVSDGDDRQRVLFAYGDTRLLAVLAEVLEDVLPPAQIIGVLAALRDHLYADHGPPQIQQLHTIMAHIDPAVVLPQWNLRNPDAVLISAAPPWGDTGTVVAGWLKEAGFRSAQVAWTYLGRTGARDDDPARWRSYLYAELRAWQPKLILPLGAEATAELLGPDRKMTEVAGQLHWVGPWAIWPLLAPGYAQKANKGPATVADLARAHSFLYDKDDQLPSPD